MVYSLQITIKSFDSQRIKECQNEIQQLYLTLNPTQQDSNGKNVVSLPTKRSHITVLRSPHIDKKSREQFEVRTHKRLIDMLEPTQQTVDSLMKLDLSAGVDVEIKL